MKSAEANKTSDCPHFKQPVDLFIGNNDEAVHQPDSFRVCPLGMQLTSPRSIPAFEILSFTIDVPEDNGQLRQIDCCGVVVNCQPEKDSELFRIWIKFIDMTEKDRQSIHQIAKTSKHLCPYCENF
ncbi:MAG TPA: hypothetical protein DCZ95_02335 [Verrucomicrobia bacterium]|nr:MAG: hypothetical protein A2X46_00510 [Lentisphaerae bacterium GWF2_57_35]HBA82910.1 hypothetical protein [Verrucomicrobiota bacterium]